MHVVIVGAGIGGLTCAVALRRRGISCEIHEAAPELRAVGAGIWMPPNAMQVLERLDLAGAVTAAGLPLDRVEIADGARLLAAVDLGRAAQRYGHRIVSLHRGELQRVLVEAIGDTPLHLHRRCTGAETRDGRAVARFEGGEVEADAVVGADGIRSAVRESLFPGVELRYAGQTCYRGIARLELGGDQQRVCRETLGGAVRFGFSAIDPRRVYFFAPVTAAAGGRDDGPIAETLVRLYAGFPSPIPDIVAAADEPTLGRLDLQDIRPLPAWHRDRVGLLGDAAHAMTPNMGQGGAQAVEDAWVLADCLAGSAAPVEAFAAYHARRRRKVGRIQAVAWHWGRVAHWENRVARALRNLGMRVGSADRQVAPMYALDF